MKHRRILWNLRLRHPRLLAVGLLMGAVVVTMAAGSFASAGSGGTGSSLPETSDTESKKETTAQLTEVSQTEEMRAVWVPVMSLQMNGEGEAAFQKKFDEIIATSLEKGMNTLIVHVRPFGDSFYPSEYFPWSHALSGTQGVDPGYDPLAYMVEAAHKAGLAIHAWVNPLRIQASSTPSILSQDNPYTLWKGDSGKKDWTVKTDSGIYYNPAIPEVRSYIADGVAEIVEKYPVDGVQFDDYFYPTQDESFDETAYQTYCEQAKKDGYSALSLSQWRKANINALVSLVYQKIKEVNPKTVFGISPQGNLSNNDALGADVASWCSAKGYLDYICPQMYVNFENDALPFTETIETWKNLITEDSIAFYVGLAVYKAGSDADGGTWEKSGDILSRQVMAGREIDCDGFMFYSYDYLDTDQTREEMENVMKVFQ